MCVACIETFLEAFILLFIIVKCTLVLIDLKMRFINKIIQVHAPAPAIHSVTNIFPEMKIVLRIPIIPSQSYRNIKKKTFETVHTSHQIASTKHLLFLN